MTLRRPASSSLSLVAPRTVRSIACLCLSFGLILPGAQANPVADYKLGLQYRQQKKDAAALGQFNLAIKQDPNFVDAYIQRIEIYCNIAQAAKTLDDCNKVITLDPAGKKYPDVYIHRAEAYKQLEEPVKLLADCKKALALGCSNKEQLCHLRVYGNKQLGNVNAAIQDLTTILDKYSPRPNTIWVYRARAELYEAANKPEQAVADLHKALALNPKFDWCYEQLATLHQNMGQPEKALDDFAALAKLNPDDERNYFERGHLELKMGRYADAVGDLSKAIAIEPRLMSRSYDYRAQAYTKLGKTDLAAKDRAMSASLKE